jgi:hypothetical protein
MNILLPRTLNPTWKHPHCRDFAARISPRGALAAGVGDWIPVPVVWPLVAIANSARGRIRYR